MGGGQGLEAQDPGSLEGGAGFLVSSGQTPGVLPTNLGPEAALLGPPTTSCDLHGRWG